MAGLKFTIHPLFFILGLYFALIGKVFSFLAFTFSAVIHELGHYYASERYGYSLNKIVLMPYGAIIKGDELDLKYKDEIIIALSGPFINICTWLFCASLWWLIPDSYPYTELMATSSLALFAINLLPCYPLDGGRVLLATLSLFLDRKKAKKIAKVVSVTFAIALIILFIYSLFTSVNISLLLFAVFILAGAFSFGGSDYVKTYSSVYLGVKTYKTVKRVAINENMPVKVLYRLIGGDYHLEVIITSGDNKRELTSEELINILETASPYAIIKEVI